MELTPIYGGTLALEFDPRKHTYRIVHPNGRKFRIPSVTSVLSVVSKPALVPWAVNCCLDVVRGSIAPDTVYSETFLEEVWRTAKGRARGVKDEAAGIGKQVHSWVESYIRGEEPVLPPEETPVRKGVDAALKWMGAHQVRFVENERPVYSRQHRYTGRMDGLAFVDDALAVVDWKTSNGVYPEYILQIAAYALAYSEETGSKISKAFLVRLGKDDGEFEAHEFDSRTLKRAGGAFLSALNLWRQLERLKKQL